MNSIVFGGINSSTYGIYISGEGVWNAPERDAETIQIPGRNGEYVLDKGNFKNIEVTYPAFNQETSYNDFRTKVDNFRNAISSLKGYQRLTDSFHPDEYRMAAFIGGLEVKPVLYNDKSMEMNIVFNCKPQRFLTSGETEQTVTSGATITNPTLFESHPLLLVDGYGDININDDVISIQRGAVMGETILKNGATQSGGTRMTADLDSNNYLQGDIITVDAGASFRLTYRLKRAQVEQFRKIRSVECVNISDGYEPIITDQSGTKVALGIRKADSTNFTAGTDSTNGIKSARFSVVIYNEATDTDIETVSLQVFLNNLDYSASNEQITIGGSGSANPTYFDTESLTIYQPQISVDSTVSVLGQLYIDLDIGECYRIENGEYISINTATTLPAELPTLKPGDNIITYGEDFTSFKITPRWWRV